MNTDSGVFVINIEKETLENNLFRKILYTTTNQQLVVMSIKPFSNIPFEIHPEHDQFIRIEKGVGMALIGSNKEQKFNLSDGISITIPKNTYHEIVNTDPVNDLKLYTIYSPPEHPTKQKGGYVFRPKIF